MLKDQHQISKEELAGCIDHTLLQAAATKEQIVQACRRAKDYGFHTVCVNGRWIALAAELLAGSKVAVGGVEGNRALQKRRTRAVSSQALVQDSNR